MAEPPPPGMEAEEPAPPGVAAEAAPAPTADEAAAAAAAYAAAYAGCAGYDPNAAGYYDQQAYWNYYYASQGYGAAAPAAGASARPAMSKTMCMFFSGHLRAPCAALRHSGVRRRGGRGQGCVVSQHAVCTCLLPCSRDAPSLTQLLQASRGAHPPAPAWPGAGLGLA